MENSHLSLKKGMSLFLDALVIILLIVSTASVGVSGSCVDNPCQHGGTCEDASGDVICQCPLLYVGDTCQYAVERIADTSCMANSTFLTSSTNYNCSMALDSPDAGGLLTEWVVDGSDDGVGAFIIIHLNHKFSVLGIKYLQRCDPLQHIEKMAFSVNDGTIELVQETCDASTDCNEHHWNTILFSNAIPNTFILKIVAMKLCNDDNVVNLGFRDISVLKPHDECSVSVNPCKNSGVCTEKDFGFDCNCDGTGFEGDTCEDNIDDCSPNPCEHGDCEDEVNSYSCTCHPGYMGDNCETKCDPGWFGDNCEWDATCLQAVDGSQRVACGYYGIRRWKCKKLGCCFDKKRTGINWCYKHLNATTLGPIMETNSAGCEYGMSNMAARVSCGYSGISEGSCRSINCCWNPQHGFNWCFEPQ